MSIMGEIHLKKERDREFSIKKLLTVHKVEMNGKKVPEISIGGGWMEMLGWKPGQQFTLQAGEHKITIEKDVQ